MSTPVIVTTAERGIYFGYMQTDAQAPAKVELDNARVIVEWDTGDKGFLFMAVNGPATIATVSVAVPTLTVFGVTSIAACTPEGAAAFDAA